MVSKFDDIAKPSRYSHIHATLKSLSFIPSVVEEVLLGRPGPEGNRLQDYSKVPLPRWA